MGEENGKNITSNKKHKSWVGQPNHNNPGTINEVYEKTKILLGMGHMNAPAQ
jgi:hypothetical protein